MEEEGAPGPPSTPRPTLGSSRPHSLRRAGSSDLGLRDPGSESWLAERGGSSRAASEAGSLPPSVSSEPALATGSPSPWGPQRPPPPAAQAPGASFLWVNRGVPGHPQGRPRPFRDPPGRRTSGPDDGSGAARPRAPGVSGSRRRAPSPPRPRGLAPRLPSVVPGGPLARPRWPLATRSGCAATDSALLFAQPMWRDAA